MISRTKPKKMEDPEDVKAALEEVSTEDSSEVTSSSEDGPSPTAEEGSEKPERVRKVKKKRDHACKGGAYTCELCSATRQKQKHKKKKSNRQGRLTSDGEWHTKKVQQPTDIPQEGRKYTNHDTVTYRYMNENPSPYPAEKPEIGG